MAQYSEAARNGMLDSLETTLGTAAKLVVYSGSVPANTGTAATANTDLLSYTMASDWAAAAASGAKALTGTPLTTTAIRAGTAGYYRFMTSGNVVHSQGPCSATGGGGEITFDNATFTAGQTVNITGFSFTVGGA